MKAYKIDFDGKKFIKISFDIAHQYDFSNEPTTMISEFGKSHNCDENIVDMAIARNNRNLVDNITEDSNIKSIMVKKCKDCGKYFIIDYNEYVWYIDRDLHIPLRCCYCRGKKNRSRK